MLPTCVILYCQVPQLAKFVRRFGVADHRDSLAAGIYLGHLGSSIRMIPTIVHHFTNDVLDIFVVSVITRTFFQIILYDGCLVKQ